MVLPIKNAEAEKLARNLSELRGESLTATVTEAVRERLERLQSPPEARLADRLLRIGKDCASHLKEPIPSADHGDILFDERRLPR